MNILNILFVDYSHLLSDVVNYSRYFVEDDTNVVDIGCSTGKLTKALLEENQDHCYKANYVGVEIAEGFFEDLDRRYEELTTYNPLISSSFCKR